MPSARLTHDHLLRLIGTAIRRHRKSRGWTQEQLAEAARLSTYFLGSVERGQAALSLRSLQQIAEALDVPLSLLCEVPPDESRDALLELLAARLRAASSEEIRVLLEAAALMGRRRN
jgi:transcriptional regulator with XRE-family HTH domain